MKNEGIFQEMDHDFNHESILIIVNLKKISPNF